MEILKGRITLLLACFVAIFATALTSCSSDDDVYWDKEYVYQNDTLQVNMTFGKSGKGYITIYIRGIVAMQDLYAAYTTSEYPALTFITDYPVKEGLVLQCNFKSAGEYMATVLSQNLQGNHYEFANREFALPRQMRFTAGHGMYDLDGDGYLDDMEHLYR